jgi:probable phosphoglycerate mutase
MLLPLPFLYLRHGRTAWNVQRRSMGRQDIPLDETGLAEARTARDLLVGEEIAAIYTSPLARARHTAEIVNDVLGCPLIEVPDLVECCWGTAEGRHPDPADPWLRRWFDGEDPPGAEPYLLFLRRALDGINFALADAERRGGRALIVAHGGIYWSVQHHAGLGVRFDLPNAVPVLHLPPPEPNTPWMVVRLDPEIE